jgi:integrase
VPKVRNRIIPGIGKHRLDRLTPEHIERFYSQLEQEGLAPATVLQVHRILSRALKVAVQRGHVARNVTALVDAPASSPAEIAPLSLADARHVMELAATQRNGSRWSVALALGLRQGEALGLRWRHVDLANGSIAVRSQLVRQRWRHGCIDSRACARPVTRSWQQAGMRQLTELMNRRHHHRGQYNGTITSEAALSSDLGYQPTCAPDARSARLSRAIGKSVWAVG